ncbi:MAG: hypothetical protein B0W54_11840 [Cellvibrio sp. 79]|nr:MAG: hypothetical protein B0W54_11840 [Cellvibrio sp. 79]
MMYLLSVISEGFKELDLPDGQSYLDFNCMRWNGESKLNQWKSPNVVWVEDEFTSSQYQEGDFTKFSGGAIALSEKAYNVLKPVMGTQAEFLPVQNENKQWYLLNVLNVQNLMDTSRSKFKIYEDGHIGPCTHAYINPPDSSNIGIFLVKGYFPNIFIISNVKDEIEKAGLTGSLIRQYINP